MYRLAQIDVRRCWPGWTATAVLADDGLHEESGEPCFAKGFDLEVGPYPGLTHRRAWCRALKANGGRIWDGSEDRG